MLDAKTGNCEVGNEGVFFFLGLNHVWTGKDEIASQDIKPSLSKFKSNKKYILILNIRPSFY